MDRASQTLAEGLEPGVRVTYTALPKESELARTTLFYRTNGRPMSNLEFPLPIKYIPSLAFAIARGRTPNPPSKNWAKRLRNANQSSNQEKFKPVDWKRHDINIYDKITQWFEVINGVL